MNLIKENWKQEDIDEFLTFLIDNVKNKNLTTIKNSNVINTKHKIIGYSMGDLRLIAKEILKGNYQEFLDFMPDDYYESIMVCGLVISKIKDFKIQKKYLMKYLKYVDSWALTDCLAFNIKKNEKSYFNLSNTLIAKNKTFYVRCGLFILFKFIDDDAYYKEIYKIIEDVKTDDYYINMMLAWLLCECMVKRRDDTLLYLENNTLVPFVVNKAISKCHDSFRISESDKEMLKKYRKK